MIDQMRRHIQRELASVRAAYRAVLTQINRAPQVQLVNGEGLAGEQLAKHELFQHFGFTSAPPAGTQLIVLPVGGRTSQAVVVASEHGAHRIVLGAQGEVCVYSQWGDRVHLRADRTIHLQAPNLLIDAPTSVTINTATLTVNATAGVTLDTPQVQASGDVQADGSITAAGDVADAGGAKTMAGMRDVYDDHKHAPGPGPDVTM